MTSTTFGVAPFPDEAAAKINEYAVKTGQAMIAALVHEVRDWLGHPEVVIDLAKSWSPGAKAELVKADDTILEARTSITANWSGAAADAYLAYLDHVSKVMQDTSDLFDQLGQKLLDVRDQITNAYKEAILLIGNTGAEIISMTGGVIASIKESWFGVADAVLQALANFMRQLTSTASQVTQIMTNFQRNAVEIAQAAAGLKIPETLPTAAAESTDWKVRAK
ncbi:hypothetical protein [Saccharopolyspora sp. ASAGF58]|uniref:hypothetical protein n=1 Tax=Saccharopolyspora sp. ASAGF58 TaxID=2719023 RepID=UPI00143FD1EB|nr:hypothetical protein [Saccharopolyspora sp. ASAGF58]QIZ35930.1 hypothetical protein FDZ84_16070 [Saccharopolyspora sp. ASAGF58]